MDHALGCWVAQKAEPLTAADAPTDEDTRPLSLKHLRHGRWMLAPPTQFWMLVISLDERRKPCRPMPAFTNLLPVPQARELTARARGPQGFV